MKRLEWQDFDSLGSMAENDSFWAQISYVFRPMSLTDRVACPDSVTNVLGTH